MFFAHFVPSLLVKHASIHYSLYHGNVKMNVFVISVLVLMSLSRCESKFKGKISIVGSLRKCLFVFALIKLTLILEDYA